MTLPEQSTVSSQDALILLRASFSAPRVQHLMPCSPPANNSALEKFDDPLKLAVTSITNSALSDAQWLQASMPIKHGGLGIRRVTSLTAAFFGLGGEHHRSPGTNTRTISLPNRLIP